MVWGLSPHAVSKNYAYVCHCNMSLKTANSSSNVVLNKALKRQNIFVNKIHAKIVNIKHMRCHT